MSRDARKPVFGFLTRSDTNRPVQPQNARKFGFRKKRDCTIRVATTKAQISVAFNAKLICASVFT